MHCPHLREVNLQGSGAYSVACISLLKCSNSIPSNLLNTHTLCACHCLTDCGVGPAGATALAGAWKHCAELEEVNFARTGGSQHTTCYIGGLWGALSHCHAHTDCKVGDDGITALSEAFKCCPVLRRVNIYCASLVLAAPWRLMHRSVELALTLCDHDLQTRASLTLASLHWRPH